MKREVYDHKSKYILWKEKVGKIIPEISEVNSKIILDYLFDMENGLNVSTGNKKGARSYNRLNNLKQRMIFLSKKFKEFYGVDDITKIEERQIHDFFTGMRNGTIKRLDGRVYQSPGDYVKIFKAFWHWHQKIHRKKGIEIYDITMDLDTSGKKPRWVYLDEKEIKKLCNDAKYEYKVLIMFLFDTGIRSPSELINIKVSDFYNDFKELNIRDEISKTFGRRSKLITFSSILSTKSKRRV